MTNRFIEAAMHASTLARQPAALLSRARTSARGVLTTAQHTLTIFGISALALIALLLARPDLGKQISHSLFPQPVAETPVTAPSLSALMDAPATAQNAAANGAPLTKEEKALLGTQKQQQWVTSWLSKRYRVANDATNMLVSTAYLTAREIKLDPLLILAVMAIESGLNPFAESPVGAQGLMQVMSKVHHEKFQDMGGVQAALNPVANIRVGSLILKDYVTRGGSVEAGLKTYVGAAAFENDSGYGSRVLAEYRRLKQVSAGKMVPTSSPVMAAAAPAPAAVKEAAAPAIKLAAHHEEIAGL
ncbi:transglycosylase SLT domain-containing protein [Janthinobacterium agaricidamnosum]|uniref:Transglycosylase SLT domain protein n=1 Tax=Janthinobacterium agaricidamnosum NBRC 102515 = DSM 9628 TaxID=1349767 RepID=W0V958_9BURK|nr:transglycosylase SLT domain-containing protein [Janthinobacterium agaricidamnosum]CDG84411.1 transglycosylase SLT domain protein [Janthinobacterium agaricidamnosum NBRC 102515 = DSM 9628]